MRKQDYLVTLIQSLNAAEKRYFKLFAALQPGEKKYMKLFDTLAEQTTYDAKQLAQKLGYTTKQIAHEKEYLQKVLIKSLRNYNDESSVEISLETTLVDIEVLYNKQQYDLAQSLVKKALQVAEEEEKFETALRLLRWEKRCMREMGQYSYFEKQYSDILAWELELIGKLENLLQIGAVHYNVFSLTQRNYSGGVGSSKRKITSVIRHPLLKNAGCAKSFTAKMLYYDIMEHWYTHHNEFTKAYEMSVTALQLMEANPLRIERHPWGYFTHISNQTGRAISLRNAAEGKSGIEVV